MRMHVQPCEHMRTHVRSLIYQLKSGLANYRARCARQPCVRDNTGIEADSRDDEQEKEHHGKSNDSFCETPTLQDTWIRKKKKKKDNMMMRLMFRCNIFIGSS